MKDLLVCPIDHLASFLPLVVRSSSMEGIPRSNYLSWCTRTSLTPGALIDRMSAGL